MTVQRETSWKTATTIASTAAIESAKRVRRSRSQRPLRLEPCSIALSLTTSTVPRWCRQPRAPEAVRVSPSRLRTVPLVEEPVDRRTGSAHIGPKRAERAQLAGDRRRREVVWRQRRQVARSPHPLERVEKRGAALVPAGRAVTRVELGVHGCRGALLHAVGQHEQHPVVLRKVDRAEKRAVAGADLRSVREEERHVRPESGGEVAQLRGRKRLASRRDRPSAE